MFLLPLGLQSRIVKWPIATLLLLIATCVVSVYYFPENALYIRHVRQAMTDSKILDARRNLVIVSCPSQFEEDVCNYLSSHLHPEDLFDSQNFMKDFRKEFENSSFLTNRKLAEWLVDDRIDRKLKNTDYVKSVYYSQYVSARENYLKQSLEKSKEDKLFIRGNAKIIPALKALFTHEGYVHLVGNMLIFLLFSIFVEQRIGTFGLLLLYLVGGLGSNFLQLPFLPMGVRLFGASGAVSAVIGAFGVFFWREKMRCLLNVGVFNRVIMMPSWLYIGLFMVFSDIVGMIGTGGGVAHLAHLTGFGIGFIFAYMQMDLFPLKKSFLFTQEQKLYYDAKDAKTIEDKISYFRRIYALNRESFYAFRGLFVYFFKMGLLIRDIKKDDQEFLRTLITGCVLFNDKKSEKFGMAYEVLGMIPLTWNLAELELKIGPENILERAEQFQIQGDLIQTLRFYDMFFAMFAAHPRLQDIQSEIIRIFDQIEKFDIETKAQILDTLLLYSDHHPDNHFQTQIQHLIHQLHREEKNAAS